MNAPVLLEDTCNSRWLPLPGRRILRTDCPHSLAGGDVRLLRENGVSLAIDLRTEKERTERPSPFAALGWMSCLGRPVFTEKSPVLCAEDAISVYRGMADESLLATVVLIEGRAAGTVYFCSAGKDRTGAVSSLLLKRAGVPDDVIVADYMLSARNCVPLMETYRRANPDSFDFAPRPEYILAFLERASELWYGRK